MQDGLYVVTFKTGLGEGAGVVTLKGDTFTGGDSAMVYRGTFTQVGNSIKATVSVARHTEGLASVLGVDNAKLELEGLGDDAVAQLKGSGSAVGLTVHMRRCGDL